MIGLGAFALEENIAQGGAGQIWSGRHLEQEIPVAIKILSPKEGAKAEFDTPFQAHFENEVRAVAGLNHPSIVTVYDFGRISAAAAQASNGALIAHRPYLVMELAEHSLQPWCGHIDWQTMRKVLLSLLDALAHSHARDIIHLDMKVENILVFDGGQRIKLTDFGLAHELQEDKEHHHHVAGTPAYMAPEQIKGEWRDYGPWTDLYALGCVAYYLASGELPFAQAAHFQELIASQLYHELPPLKTAMKLPNGFDAWLRRLTAKSIGERFHRAADAARELMELGEFTQRDTALLTTLEAAAFRIPGPTHTMESPEDVQYHTMVEGGPALERCTLQPAQLPAAPTQEMGVFSESPSDATQEMGAFTLVEAENETWIGAPLSSSSWQGGESATPAQLHSVGLGLFGLRATPMVDREEEREQLWQTLCEVAQGDLRFAVLRGGTGCGKSRLAAWLTERAHELGAATVLKATHNALPGPGDGLGPMCTRFFRCQDLSHQHTIERLYNLFREGPAATRETPRKALDYRAIAALVQPHATPAGAPPSHDAARATIQINAPNKIRFGSSIERYETIRQLLTRLCMQRPMILWLDDAQWGADALEFVLYLQKQQQKQPLPLFVLATVRDEALEHKPYAATILEELLVDNTAQDISLPPLSQEHQKELIQRLLGLTPQLVDKVTTHTRGNPLFATQLIGEWVQGGLLQPSARGYTLRNAADVLYPNSIGELWSQRLSRLLAGRSRADHIALELAAALGHEVDGGEWLTTCQIAGLNAPFDLIEQMLKQGLANTGTEGPRDAWSFAHESLRAAVEASVSGTDWRSHHRRCIEAIRISHAPGTERMAHHLEASGQPEAALESFIQAANRRIEKSDYRIADQLLSRGESLLAALSLPKNERRWGQLWLHKGQLALLRGDVKRAESWAMRVAIQVQHWPSLRVPLLLLQAHIHTNTGRPQAALKTAQDAVVAEHETPRTLAQSLMRLGRAYLECSRIEEAEDVLQQALVSYSQLHDDYGMGYTYLILSNAAQRRSDYQRAEALTKRAIPHFVLCGSRVNIAHSSVFLGESMRHRGNFDMARKHYEHAIHLFNAMGAPLDDIPRSNIGLILLETKQYVEAYQLFLPLRDDFLRRGRREMVATIEAYLLFCAVFMEEWKLASMHMQKAQKAFAATEKHDIDVARFAQEASLVAQRHGQLTLAEQTCQLALQQWEALGRQNEAAQTQRLLDELQKWHQPQGSSSPLSMPL